MSDPKADRVVGDMDHTKIHVERIKAPSRMTFDPEDHRRWHTMGVMWAGRQARYCIPLSLGEGSAEGELRVPVLAGYSGLGCYVQERSTEPVKIPVEDGDDIEYERVVWTNVGRDCHHPVVGKMVVVIEPSVTWRLVEQDEGPPQIQLAWEEDTSPLGGYDPGSREALIEQIREDIEENRAELAVFVDTDTEQLHSRLSEEDVASAKRIQAELTEQIAFLHELEEKARAEEQAGQAKS